jgi:2-C-methyl-D-erythritol 4-phosphate cytidylyltransferase/2-C-methyl-D-erythritol 4-phosphate cytidylyltransferase/2-C-methyl-D-erythritol 2,4-cyclodiphosphate synthase
MEGAREHSAAVPLLPLAETPKEIDGRGFIRRHLRRSSLGCAQTPQGFAFPGILRAHEQGAERELAEAYEYTDDAELWGEFCGPVAAVQGERENRKITYPEDLGALDALDAAAVFDAPDACGAPGACDAPGGWGGRR